MNFTRFICVTILLTVFTDGCASIPKAEYRIEREKVLKYSFDDAWASALEAVKKINGNTIAYDKASGVIVYGVFDRRSKSWIYANVYLRKSQNGDITRIVFIPKTLRGYCMNDIEKDFFLALSQDSNTISPPRRIKLSAKTPEDRFYDFEAPDAAKIKEKGDEKEFIRKSFEEVWDSLVSVAMQKGIIIKISKEKGIIVIASHPLIMSMLVEGGASINVYARIDSIDEMVPALPNEKKVKLKLEKSMAQDHINIFFEQLATEVYAREKWKYLT